MVLHIQKYPQPFAIVNLSKPDTAAKVLFMTQVVGVASAEQCIAKYASYLKTSLESMGALYILMQMSPSLPFAGACAVSVLDQGSAFPFMDDDK